MKISKKEKRFFILFSVALLIFIAVNLPFVFRYAMEDENVYMHMGLVLSEGGMPYADFFFSHPPAQTVLFAALIKLFGFSYFMLKAVPLAAAALAGIFLFLTVRKAFGLEEALIASVLFLFSGQVMIYSSLNLGVCLTAMFLLAGVLLQQEKRPFAAGTLFGLSGLTGLYAVVPFAGLLAVLIWQRNWESVKMLSLGFAAVFGGANLALAAAFPGYVEQVYLLQFMKPHVSGTNALEIFSTNITLALLTPLAAVYAWRRKQEKLLPFLGAALALLMFFIVFMSVHAHYIVLLLPFWSLLVAVPVYALLKSRLGRDRTLMLFFILIVPMASWSAVWQASWYGSKDIQSMDGIAAFVSENSEPDDLLYGDDASLVSMLTGRQVPLWFIDNNAHRYESGITDVSELLESLEDVKFVMARRGGHEGREIVFDMMRFRQYSAFIDNRCRLASTFETGAYYVYEGSPYRVFYDIYDCEQP